MRFSHLPSFRITVKSKILSSVFFTLYSLCGIAQPSASGTVINYSVLCPGGVCEDTSNPSDNYIYVAPHDGTLQISGFAADLVIPCCNNPQGFSVGGFRKLNAPANIHTFENYSTTGYLDCIKQGDSIEINFNGSYGNYEYIASVIPDTYSADVEPNDINADAVEISSGSLYIGHLGYGIYEYDLTDVYRFEAPFNGMLKLDYQFTDDFSLKVFKQNSVQISGQTMSNQTQIFVQDCMAAGDIIYIRMTRLFNCIGYQFDVDFEPTEFGDDLEPNNSFGEAVPLSGNMYGSTGHGISNIPKDGLDYFDLGVVNTGEEINLEIESQGGQLRFELKNSMFSGFTENLGVFQNEVVNISYTPTIATSNFLLKVSPASSLECGSYRVARCNADIALSSPLDDYIAPFDIHQKTDMNIIASNKVNNNKNVLYEAGNSIMLNPDFEVLLNSHFHAFIGGCDLP